MIKANLSNLNEVIDILYDAFESVDIPNTVNLIVKNDDKRDRRLLFLMKYLTHKAYKHGSIYMSDNRTSCLLVEDKSSKNIDFKSTWWNIKLAWHTIGITRIFKILRWQKLVKKYRNNEPQIHPIIMGVRKSIQGNGDAPRLIEQVMREYDTGHKPIFIETTTLENVRLYESFGFRVTANTKKLGFPLVFMRKY